MAHVEFGVAPIAVRVERIRSDPQTGAVIDRMAPGVRVQHLETVREAFAQVNLEAVVYRVGVGQLIGDAAEYSAAERVVQRVAEIENAPRVGVQRCCRRSY